MFRHFFTIGLGLLACSGTAQADADYLCRSVAGSRLSVTLLEGTTRAEMNLVDTDGSVSTLPMQQIRATGPGFRYAAANDGPQFWVNGEEGTWTLGSRTSFCRLVANSGPVDAVPDPDPPTGGTGYDGISFGGALLAGPGDDYPRVGRLRQNTSVTLLDERSEIVNGHSFWLIRIPNGEVAYQWGGNLCAPGLTLSGIQNGRC